MRQHGQALALAFIQSHPGAAAQLLESQDIGAVTGFLKSIPQRYAALIMPNMLPLYAARVLANIGGERAAGMVARLDASALAAILRYAKGRTRHKVLRELPVKMRSTCTLLLTYTEDSVGAWMDPSVFTVPVDTSVADALDRIRGQATSKLVEPILCVGRDRMILGVVSLPNLLVAHPESRLNQSLLKPLPQLPARMTVQSAIRHAGWTESDVLAVVNSNKQLVGILRHCVLRKGIRQLSTDSDQRRSDDPMGGVFEAYGGALLALVSTLSPPSRTSNTTGAAK